MSSSSGDDDEDIVVQRPDQRIEMLLNEMRSEGASVIMDPPLP